MLGLHAGEGNLRGLPLPSLRVEGIFMHQKLQQIVQKPAPLNVSSGNAVGGLISPQSPASQTSGRTVDPSLVRSPFLLDVRRTDLVSSRCTNVRVPELYPIAHADHLTS